MLNHTTRRIAAIAAALTLILTPTAAHASEVIAQDLTVTSSPAAKQLPPNPMAPTHWLLQLPPDHP